MVAMDLSLVALSILRHVTYIPSLFSAFVMKGCLALSKAFSASK
jgi:hypothetical protein